MSLTARSGGVDRPLIPADVYIAVCHVLVDLGTHENTYEGKTEDRHEVQIGWQIPDADRVEYTYQDKEYDIPATVWKRYTLSVGKKSNLGKDLAAWRGKDFTDEERKGFDVRTILSKSCQIQVVHKTSQSKGKTYTNVGGIMSLPKGVKGAEIEGDPTYFSFEEWDGTTLPDLPDWLLDILKTSNEYREAVRALGIPDFSGDTEDLADFDEPGESEEVPF